MFDLPAMPIPLSRLVGKLPGLPVSVVFVTLFNRMAWRGLHDLDWAALRGKRFCVHVRDLGGKSYFSVTGQGLRPEMADHADVTFTATSDDFLRLALRLEDPDTLFFNRRLLIEGNTDLGLTVKNMLDAVELDTLLATMPAPIAGLLAALRRRMVDAGMDLSSALPA
jgi:predicted lipid carrier protein YhbT